MNKKILLLALVLIPAIYLSQHLTKVPEITPSQPTNPSIVLKHGDTADLLGARDVFVYGENGKYYMTYDGANVDRWAVNEAVSTDLIHWKKLGIVLDHGAPGELDSASADYGTIHKTDAGYNMYYLGTPNQTSDAAHVPAFPYNTMKAHSASPTGPWVKDPGQQLVTAGYTSVTASPGPIIKQGNEYLMFFSAATTVNGETLHTLGIARSASIDGPWLEDIKPILPGTEQIENISLYKQNDTWLLFTNHIAFNEQGEGYTDSVLMYWSKDINHWSAQNKKLIITGNTNSWSHTFIGLPSIIAKDNKLYVFYDGKTSGFDVANPNNNHIDRDIGLKVMQLPIRL